MNIAIIDADLIGRSKHRFPNLACMKISGYYKSLGYKVTSSQHSRSVEGIIIYESFIDDYCVRTNGYNYPLKAMLPSNRVEIIGRHSE